MKQVTFIVEVPDEAVARVGSMEYFGLLAIKEGKYKMLRRVPAAWRNVREPTMLRKEPPHPDYTHLWAPLYE